ncbi:MAG: hypothetical protein K0R14_666 [Burkholderiales bacterium]|jgi:hypothetical protein|nr:hypothetical protein [Burkholderiales bacterium]
MVTLYPTTHFGKINTANSIEIPFQANDKLAGYWNKDNEPLSAYDKIKGYSYTGYKCPGPVYDIKEQGLLVSIQDFPLSLNK